MPERDRDNLKRQEARLLLLELIAAGMVEQFEAEKAAHEVSFQAFAWLMTTSPILRKKGETESAIRQAAKAVETNYKIVHTVGVIKNLGAEIIASQTQGVRHVLVDTFEPSLPEHFNALSLIYSGKETELEQLRNSGKEQGTQFIWELLRDPKEIPLVRPSLLLAQKEGVLQDIRPREKLPGFMGFVPTKIDGVRFRYTYGEEPQPSMCIVVKPIM